jgi:hypothetical protein
MQCYHEAFLSPRQQHALSPMRETSQMREPRTQQQDICKYLYPSPRQFQLLPQLKEYHLVVSELQIISNCVPSLAGSAAEVKPPARTLLLACYLAWSSMVKANGHTRIPHTFPCFKSTEEPRQSTDSIVPHLILPLSIDFPSR